MELKNADNLHVFKQVQSVPEDAQKPFESPWGKRLPSAPMIEPMRAHPTYQPCCMVSSENCCVTLPVVPDITALSYPKSIPPMAEATERKMMYPVLVPACPDDVMMLFNFIFNGNKNNENSY